MQTKTKRPSSRKGGRKPRLIQLDCDAVESMPQATPDDVRKRARAYSGDHLAGIWYFANRIEEAFEPSGDAFATQKERARLKSQRLMKVFAALAGEIEEMQYSDARERLSQIVQALFIEREQRLPSFNLKRHRCSIVERAYANVWENLQSKGVKSRPSYRQLRSELKRGLKNLEDSNPEEMYAIEQLRAVLSHKKLSAYTGNLRGLNG